MENINPIGELMQSTMDNVKNILKVDTVVGDPIVTPDGITLVPISRIILAVLNMGSPPCWVKPAWCRSSCSMVIR